MRSWSCLFLCLILSLLLAAKGEAQLTDARSVRSLTAEQAKEAVAVKLWATVTLIESPGTVFVQDATAGTFLRTKLALGDLAEGDVVEAQGHTFPGLFLPGIELDSLQVVGHAELPKAQPASYDDLTSARFHYQRVSVEGIVRSIQLQDENRSIVRLAMGSRVVEIRVDGPAPGDDTLLDAKVRIEGLAAGSINDRRQLVQPYLRVSRWSALAILEPGRSAQDIPVATTASLLRFSATGDTGHRVRVEGNVTGVFKQGLVFIRDEEASIAVQFAEEKGLHLGDRITVTGFPVMDRFTPTLVDVQLLESHVTVEPEAVEVPIKTLAKRVNDGDLISITGTIAQAYHGAEGATLLLVGDGQRIPVLLSAGDTQDIEVDSTVKVTGIARVESVSGKGFNARPETFSLWLRTRSDLVLLRVPSFWNVRQLLTILGVMVALVMAGVVWILMLRRQVSILQLRIRHEAALEERQRIAREFHDTLEQELAGLSLRMDAAATRPMEEKARALLDTSRNLVSRIQAEARNLVADLRDEPDSQMGLPEALQELAERQPANAPLITVKVEGELPVLPSSTVHHLRMIAQEAVTNALKHARASNITLRLRGDDSGLQLAVVDDGTGFDPEAETLGKPGHFGCMGIRERCRKMGANVQWTSSPSSGTTMEVHFKP